MAERRKTVLIADDEKSLRMLVRATIAADGYHVEEAGDGEQAWEIARRVRPDLVLLDVTMPGWNGLEVARLIRSDPALAHVRIIMLTAKAEPHDVSVGLASGADWYLTKPFSPLELLDIVARASAGN